MIEIDNEEYFSISEISEMFNVKPNTISSWRRNNKINSLQISTRKHLFSKKAIKDMLFSYNDTLPKIKRSDTVIEYSKSEYTSSEVCDILKISGPTLLKWRNDKLIKFRKISDRKIFYPIDEIRRILDKGVDTIFKNTEPVIIKKTFRELAQEKTRALKTKSINNETEEFVKNWIVKFRFKILETDKGLHNIFLNFNNIITTSMMSPLIMINNKCELIDVLNDKLLINNNEIIDFLKKIDKDKKEPLLEYSDKIRNSYETFYLYIKNSKHGF